MSPSSELVDPLAAVRSYLEAEKSSNTRRAYAADWADFVTWTERVSCPTLPAAPIDVARYLAHLADAGLKTSTVQRRVASIRAAHKAAGFEPPTNAEGVKAVMRGIRRRLGKRKKKAAPATAELLAAALAKLPEDLRGKRDRALLAIGFAAARRRSELIGFDVEDIERRSRGIVLYLRRSKTDQEGEGETLPVPNGRILKPVSALDAWLEAAGIASGPIFREVDRHGRVAPQRLSDRSVSRIIKKVLGAAGLEASAFSGHSLRAGFVTDALEHKVDPFKIMKQTGHVKVDTLREYDRRENDFDDLSLIHI